MTDVSRLRQGPKASAWRSTAQVVVPCPHPVAPARIDVGEETVMRSPTTSTIDHPRGTDAPAVPVTGRLDGVAASIAVAIALLYGSIATGLVELPGAGAEERAILGAAGAVSVALALLLLRPRRWVWAVVVVVQLTSFAMYLAIATDRDPAFEPWGIAIRALSVVLVVVVVRRWFLTARGRLESPRPPRPPGQLPPGSGVWPGA